MTDLIARLEEQMARKFGFPTRRWMDLAVSAEDTDAILHALKVQQAAEAYVDNLGAEKEWIHHANLVRAVKGEQP